MRIGKDRKIKREEMGEREREAEEGENMSNFIANDRLKIRYIRQREREREEEGEGDIMYVI